MLVTVGSLVANLRSQKSDIERLESEIQRLRTWRHKVGDDPCHALLTLVKLLEQEIEHMKKDRR